MVLTTRLTHNFAEVKVDEIETTLWKSNPNEVEDFINHLLEQANDLASLIGKEVEFKIINNA